MTHEMALAFEQEQRLEQGRIAEEERTFFEQYQQQGKRPVSLARPTLHMWHEVRRGLQLPPVLSNCQSVLQARFTGRNLWIIGTRTLAG